MSVHERVLLSSLLLLTMLPSGLGQARVPQLAPEQASLRALEVSEDPNVAVQWGLENDGSLGGLIDLDVDAAGAWRFEKGQAYILVGVLDTGVDIDHPDLQGILWTNEVELAGLSGVDDDGNGCIDDIHGCNFVGDCTASTPLCTPSFTGNVNDPNGHGTAVAGVIAAAADNGIGGSGVAPEVRIVPLQVATPEGYFWDHPSAGALEYAAEMGIQIINISAYFDGDDLERQERALETAIDAGSLIIASAGNWGVNLEEHTEDLPFLPSQAELPGLMKIAAVDRYGTLISYPGWWGSCFGPESVHIAGPSQAIVTTRPGNSYSSTFNGTSASAPFVSGAAALVLSADPSLDNTQVMDILMASGQPLDSLGAKTISGKLVNANNAVLMALGEPAAPSLGIVDPGEIELDTDFTLSPQEAEISSATYRWSFDDGQSAEGYSVSYSYSMEGVYNILLEVELESGVKQSAWTQVVVPPTWQSLDMTLESEHPVNSREELWISLPDARFARFHFAELELYADEDDFVGDDDALRFTDVTGTPIWGTSESATDFWTPPIPVMEDGLVFTLDLAYSGAWGYEIDEVQFISDEVVDEQTEDEGRCGCDSHASHSQSALMGFLGLLFIKVGRRREVLS